MRILIVEDHGPMRRALARVLRGAGFACTVASNHAMGALCLMQRNPPFHMVVTDYDLGDGSGDNLLTLAAQLHPKAYRILHTGNLWTKCRDAHEIHVKGFDSVGLILRAAQALNSHLGNELST